MEKLASSDGSAVVTPLYQSKGYWPQNPSYPPGPALARQWPTLTTTTGSLSPYDNLSIGSSGVQQQQRMNASQQPSPQPTQQNSIHTPDHFGLPFRPTSYFSFPPMKEQNDRPFKCDQCPQSFVRNHDLKRHKGIHLVMKPFPCGHCEKSFSRKDALKRHVLVKGCGKNANGASNANVDEHTVIDKSETMGDSTEGESPEI